MSVTKESLEKFNKEQLVTFALELQDKNCNLLENINKTVVNLMDKVNSLEGELAVTRRANEVLRNELNLVNMQTWKNAQYSRRETLEIVGIDSGINEMQVCEFLTKAVNVDVSPDDIVACHPLPSPNKNKIIVKFLNRKKSDSVLNNRKRLKDLNLSQFNFNFQVGSNVFVNESLCQYYKFLWSNLKRLKYERKIHSFWIRNGTLKYRKEEAGTIFSVYHMSELNVNFPGYPFSDYFGDR